MRASVSVIVPVYNGAALLDRAVRSVLVQTFSDWELIAVDDGSSDDSYTLLNAWAETDPRIRVIRLPENSGLSAARNAALRTATGEMVAYLDHDDEYFPNFLQLVVRHQDKGDVLVFGYDIVYEPLGDGRAERVESCDPGKARGDLFVKNPVVPLGIAHRRTLVEKVGAFNEMLWREEDWDYWKRLARAGAEFVFLPLKSGRYHVRVDSLSRVPHLTARQRRTAVANWEAGRPIFEVACLDVRDRDGGSQPDTPDAATTYWGSFGGGVLSATGNARASVGQGAALTPTQKELGLELQARAAAGYCIEVQVQKVVNQKLFGPKYYVLLIRQFVQPATPK